MSQQSKARLDAKAAARKAKPAPTVAQLVEQGNKALSKLNPELAYDFFNRALQKSADDTSIMDTLADVCLQIGEPEQALALLQQSTALAPDANPFKWLYLAQLQHGMDALASYQRAIEMLTRLHVAAGESEASMMVGGGGGGGGGGGDGGGGQELFVVDNDEQRERPSHSTHVLSKQLCKAYCSLAELFLTDLCYEEGAEVSCETYIGQALAIDAHSLDAQQTLASLRLSQTRGMEACETMEQVFARVKHTRDVVAARTVMEEIAGAPESSELADNPEPEFCIATAKLLTECAALKPALAESAMDLIASLLAQDDENIELWYIMGVAALGTAPPDLDAARLHLEKARELVEIVRENTSAEEFPFGEQLRLVNEHLAMIDREGGGGGGAEEEDEEWSDVDEEAEEEPDGGGGDGGGGGGGGGGGSGSGGMAVDDN